MGLTANLLYLWMPSVFVLYYKEKTQAASLPFPMKTEIKRRNIYVHDIDLKKVSIQNASSTDFAAAIEKIPYRGYEVEDISDGRKIVIVNLKNA